MIQTLEEVSMNAWPSLQTVLDDGWVLRFANGHTRRANSVHPLYPSHRTVEEKIQFCENTYREKGLPVIFKMTPASQPEGLDAVLDTRCYRAEWLTSVQTVNLRTPSPHWGEGWGEGQSGIPYSASLVLTDRLTSAWFAASCAMGGIADRRQVTLQQMLQNVMMPACFASIEGDGQTLACGLGVYQDGFVGLFDIVTDGRFRRQGFGQALVQALLRWGKQQGAHTGYLQVMLNNEPALQLYEKLGFREVYQYWYRIK